jgi:hypothetical protein
MMQALAATLCLVLAGIATLHAYWGVGGRWPAKDENSLADMVIGKTPGGRMPPPAACFAVAGAILIGVGLIVLVSFSELQAPLKLPILLAYGVFTAVFLLRGAAGYVPAIWRRSAGTTFVRLNTRYYSPLCLLLGAGLIANLAGR